MNPTTDDDPNPPVTPLYQRTTGDNNIVIGSVGLGATVNISRDEEVVRGRELLDQGRLAFNSKRYADATAYAESALRRLTSTSDTVSHADAQLMAAYASFLWFKTTRDKRILKEHAVPAFEAVAKLPADPSAKKNYLGEASAYLAWCSAYLGGTGAREHAHTVAAELGQYSELTRWANKAVTTAETVESTKSWASAIAGTAAVIAIMILFVKFVLIPIIDSVLG
jgi:hypothetical protein